MFPVTELPDSGLGRKPNVDGPNAGLKLAGPRARAISDRFGETGPQPSPEAGPRDGKRHFAIDAQTNGLTNVAQACTLTRCCGFCLSIGLPVDRVP